MPMTYLTLAQRWPRFANRLTAALDRRARELRRWKARLEIDMPVYSHVDSGFAIDAGVMLKRAGLRQGAVAAVRVLEIPEKLDEHALDGLAEKVVAVAEASLAGRPPSAKLPVFIYPPEHE